MSSRHGACHTQRPFGHVRAPSMLLTAALHPAVRAPPRLPAPPTSSPPVTAPPPCRDNRADTEEDKAFDVLTRELVFEAKAKPGERTLTGAAGRRQLHRAQLA